MPRRAEAPARGLPRPVLLPPPRSRRADRRNGVGDGHAGAPGQGAVLGHVGMAGAGDPRSAQGRARAQPASRRRWSSRSTTCCTANASNSNTRRCIPNTAWAPTIWSPLASGLLTGKYNDGRAAGFAARRRKACAGCRSALLDDPKRGASNARASSPRSGAGTGRAARTARDRLVPAQPACVDGDARRHEKEQLLQNLEALELVERFDDATWSRMEAATA